jgi:alkyl hydroperoxide reductase subunit AhpC
VSIEVGDAAPVVNVEAYVKGEAASVPMRIGGSSCSWTVLFFYPRDYAYAYPPELRGFSELQAAFALEGASLVAASMDSWHVHRAWFGTSPGLTSIRYPVVADSSQELTRGFGVLNEEDGSALCATFVIDPEGVVRYAVTAVPGARPSAEETLEVVRALRMGELSLELVA